MRKAVKRIGICLMLAVIIWTIALIGDKNVLREELIRLHVVAASDSEEDQALKLRVRDAVTESLRREMANLKDVQAAREYLRAHLPKIQALAEDVLRQYGCDDPVTVSFLTEEFEKRVYDTFSLPSGIYQSLRIRIGEAEGQNWWCVVFPSLCLPATSAGFEDAAACAGLDEDLIAALQEKEGYEIKFYLLEVLGRIENMLHKG